MRAKKINMGKPQEMEFIPVELHRITEEEFEMWNDELCVAWAE
jgi:hypothetical protein